MYFFNIQRLKENNDKKFHVGDDIVIQTKLDGVNTCVTWENNQLKCAMKHMQITKDNPFYGFWNYISNKDVQMFSSNPNYVVYGEWMGRRHSVIYNDNVWNKWYVFDIYDKENRVFLNPYDVKAWCDKWDMNHVEILYDGQFISWEHTKNFLHSSVLYGDIQEGIVVKNMNYLDEYDVINNNQPSYIKIINQEFTEIRVARAKERQQNNWLSDEDVLETIVTKNRVIKEINKMYDEGITDYKSICEKLTKRIIADCIKEEKDIYMSVGEKADSLTDELTMKYAKEYFKEKN